MVKNLGIAAEEGLVGDGVGFDGFDLGIDLVAEPGVRFFEHPRLELRETDVAAHIHLAFIFFGKTASNVAINYSKFNFTGHHLEEKLFRAVAIFCFDKDGVAYFSTERFHTPPHR